MAPSIERAFPAAPASTGRGLIASSFQYYLTGEENLRVEAYSVGAGVRVLIQGRFWSEDDRAIKVFERSVVASSATTAAVDTFRLERGALLNLRVVAENPGVRYGHLFARAQVVRGLTGSVVVLGTLLQGYINASNDLGWPGTPLQSMHEGRGVPTDEAWTFFSGPPALLYIVPSGTRARIVSGWCSATTSAVAGNRIVLLRVLTAASVTLYEAGPNATQGAGAVFNYSFGEGLAPSEAAPGGLQRLSFPTNLELGPSQRLQILMAADQAGDAFTNGALLVRRWMDA